MLITGSILSLNSKFLIHSFVGYIPAILGGLIGAVILGIIVGWMFKISPQRIILNYVLPIMRGGNGGGAVPLAQMYEEITGLPGEKYYEFSIIILAIANIFAIVSASLLNSLGRKHPHLTGDKNRIVRKDKQVIEHYKEDYKPTTSDIGGGLIVALSVYALGILLSNVLIPEILGVKIHNLAYTIVIVVIIAAVDVILEHLK